MIVYAFNYCPCIHESATQTISLHKSLKGAEMALQKHKLEALKRYNYWILQNEDYDGEDSSGFGMFGEDERWEVEEVEILD